VHDATTKCYVGGRAAGLEHACSPMFALCCMRARIVWGDCPRLSCPLNPCQSTIHRGWALYSICGGSLAGFAGVVRIHHKLNMSPVCVVVFCLVTYWCCAAWMGVSTHQLMAATQLRHGPCVACVEAAHSVPKGLHTPTLPHILGACHSTVSNPPSTPQEHTCCLLVEPQALWWGGVVMFGPDGLKWLPSLSLPVGS
jgi:hypothetical protein